MEIDGSDPFGEVSWRTERWTFARGFVSCDRHCAAARIRGRGRGTVAQRLLIDHLFENTTTNRVQSDTASDNPAEQRALERAGMIREGVVRGAEYRNGTLYEHLLYGIVRDDWSATSRSPT